MKLTGVPMQQIKLIREEKAIEDALVRGEYVPVSKEEFDRIAAMLARRRKDAVLNIRVNSYDLKMIKEKAQKLGVKYQTFISEVLHRVAKDSISMPKSKLLIFIAALSIASAGLADEASKTTPEPVTGLEWLEMSAGERLDQILMSMYILTHNGVELSQSPDDYDRALEENLVHHPDLYSKSLTDILALIVYDKESQTRPALDKARKKPEIKQIEMH